MIKACVIGYPIEHSRSPIIHNYWVKRYSIDGSFKKTAVRPDEVSQFLSSLKANGLKGCNVTVPLKELAFKAAEITHDSAKAVRAANTMWLDEQGRLNAENTDTYGFMAHLKNSVPDWNSGTGPVSILGAGGAARAIVYGFKQAGIDKIHVYNRTYKRAQELADEFGPTVSARDWQDRTNCSDKSRIIVNTTTIGMNGEGTLDLDFSNANKTCVVCDIVYVPLETGLLARARMAGLRTLDGLGMLMNQAVPGFERWFGVRPEVTNELRELLLADIEASKCS